MNCVLNYLLNARKLSMYPSVKKLTFRKLLIVVGVVVDFVSSPKGSPNKVSFDIQCDVTRTIIVLIRLFFMDEARTNLMDEARHLFELALGK